MQRELIPGLLPVGETSILGGASGAGKTTLMFQLLKAAQRGAPEFMGFPLPRRLSVGLIAGDRAWPSYERLGHEVGLDMTQLPFRSLVSDERISLTQLKEDPLKLLQHLMSSLMPVDLIVVDPLVMFFGVDTNRYNLVCAKAIELGRWCSKNEVTILGTHHAVKARTDVGFKRPQDRISGSAAIQGFTSTQMFLETASEADDGVAAFHIFSHHAPPRSIKLVRQAEPPGLFVNAEPSPTDDGAVTLINLLEKGRMTRHELLSQSGLTPSTFDRTTKELEAAKVIHRPAYGLYERL